MVSSRHCRVTVPATSANLGSGFDTLAVALDLHLTVTAHRRPQDTLTATYRGPQPNSVPLDSSNLIFRALSEGLARVGERPSGLHLSIDSEIPIGVGLGSSAAAIVSGLLIAGLLSEEMKGREDILELAAASEGHPDNVAAALLGGFVAAVDTGSGVLARRADLDLDLNFIVVTPEEPLSTQTSRAVLPDSYDRADAVWNLQRVALLTASFFSGGSGLRPELFQDRLHQSHRAALVPGLAECLATRHPDLLGVFLSGAGSSVVAVARSSEVQIAQLLTDAFSSAGVSSRSRLLKPDNLGARSQMVAGV